MRGNNKPHLISMRFKIVCMYIGHMYMKGQCAICPVHIINTIPYTLQSEEVGSVYVHILKNISREPIGYNTKIDTEGIDGAR